MAAVMVIKPVIPSMVKRAMDHLDLAHRVDFPAD